MPNHLKHGYDCRQKSTKWLDWCIRWSPRRSREFKTLMDVTTLEPFPVHQLHPADGWKNCTIAKGFIYFLSLKVWMVTAWTLTKWRPTGRDCKYTSYSGVSLDQRWSLCRGSGGCRCGRRWAALGTCIEKTRQSSAELPARGGLLWNASCQLSAWLASCLGLMRDKWHNEFGFEDYYRKSSTSAVAVRAWSVWCKFQLWQCAFTGRTWAKSDVLSKCGPSISGINCRCSDWKVLDGDNRRIGTEVKTVDR